jgi:hypothetical protein
VKHAIVAFQVVFLLAIATGLIVTLMAIRDCYGLDTSVCEEHCTGGKPELTQASRHYTCRCPERPDAALN